MRTPSIVLALFLGTLLACDTDGVLAPPLGLSHAVASATCGPTDGPGVAVLLAPSALESASPTQPNVRLNVWRPATDLVGTWSLAPSSVQGSAARIGSAGSVIDGAAHGSITVLSVREDGTVVGNVDLVLRSGEQVRGGFRARWIPTTPMCG